MPAFLMFILHVLELENLIQRVFRDFFVCSGLQLVDLPPCLPKGPYLVDFTKHANETTLGYVAVEQQLANDYQNWAADPKTPLPPVDKALWRSGNFVLRGGNCWGCCNR